MPTPQLLPLSQVALVLHTPLHDQPFLCTSLTSAHSWLTWHHGREQGMDGRVPQRLLWWESR